MQAMNIKKQQRNRDIRTPKDDIDEVHPRIYMSGYAAADSWETLQRCGITHILTVTPHARPRFEDKGIVYMVLEEVQDNTS